MEGPAGAKVRVGFSEVLGPDRAFDNRNFRSARVEQHYPSKSDGIETYAHLFTFFGFRDAHVTLTGWGDAVVIILWQLCLHYGDTAVLAENFPAMVKRPDDVWGISNGPIVQPPS